VYNSKVADSGDVVTGKQGLSTVDTRVPAIAMTLSSFHTELDQPRDIHILIFEDIEIKYF
jgi:hypothetical protein